MTIFTYIKDRVHILEVIGEYVTLKKAGLYFKGHCPFHHEKTASFTVSPHKDIFYCFGCHMGGDIISFISKVEQCTQFEAAKHLADRYNIDIPEQLLKSHGSHTESIEEKNRYFELCKLVAMWCHEQLKKNPSVLKYVTDRSISSSSIDMFTIGYFPGGMRAINSLLAYVQRHNLLAQDLINAHIISQGKNVLYSPFEERIIFCIKDYLGRFCGFGGRRFKPHDERAKYYNSRENNHFNKGSLLFGLDQAKKEMSSSEEVFMVEGYTDCVAMVQHGYPNTVATLGTACTVNHLKILSRYAHRIYVVYDADNAGTEAVLRLTDLCWQVNMELFVITLPSGEDPASILIQDNNIDAYKSEAKDIFDYFIATVGADFSKKPLASKLKIAQRILALIEQVDDPIKQDILLQKAAQTLNIPFTSLKKGLEQFVDKNSDHKEQAEPEAEPINTSSSSGNEPLPKLEKSIFFAIMSNIQLLTQENEEYILTYLPEPLKSLVNKLNDMRNKEANLTFNEYYATLTSDEQLFISKILLEGERETAQQDFNQLILQLQKKHWKGIVSSIKYKIAQAKKDGNISHEQEIMHDFIELKKKMMTKKLR